LAFWDFWDTGELVG